MPWPRAFLTYDQPRYTDEYSFSGRGRRRYVIAPLDKSGQPAPREPQASGYEPTLEPGEPRG